MEWTAFRNGVCCSPARCCSLRQTVLEKAGLVSREWPLDLANYRRNGYDFDARYALGEDVLEGEVPCGACGRNPMESKARIIQYAIDHCEEILILKLSEMY